jgi:hypothetical protein
MRQGTLFEEMEMAHAPQLPAEVREEVTELLRQWLQALVKTISEECGDEQDHR